MDPNRAECRVEVTTGPAHRCAGPEELTLRPRRSAVSGGVEQEMIEACAHDGGDVEVGGYSGEEPFGDVAEFGVGVLGVPDESPCSSRTRSPTTTTERVCPWVSMMRWRLLNAPPRCGWCAGCGRRGLCRRGVCGRGAVRWSVRRWRGRIRACGRRCRTIPIGRRGGGRGILRLVVGQRLSLSALMFCCRLRALVRPSDLACFQRACSMKLYRIGRVAATRGSSQGERRREVKAGHISVTELLRSAPPKARGSKRSVTSKIRAETNRAESVSDGTKATDREGVEVISGTASSRRLWLIGLRGF